MSFEYTFIFLFFILEWTKNFILFEKLIFFTFWKLKMFYKEMHKLFPIMLLLPKHINGMHPDDIFSQISINRKFCIFLKIY